MRRSLDNLTLQVEDGEVLGFLGPNGAGKTTTLKLLMGLIFPTAGTARIRGRSIDDIAMHREIGYLPEQPYFYDYLTAPRTARLLCAIFRLMARRNAGSAWSEFLEMVGLAAAADVQLRKFSKGMLQRAGIAQAILHDPKVVFLDEPMSGLDPVGRREVRDIILQLKQQGRTVFFSTHILSDAEMLCDRVAVLAGGKLQGVGAPGEHRLDGSARNGNPVRRARGPRVAARPRRARRRNWAGAIASKCRRGSCMARWISCGPAKRAFFPSRRFAPRWKIISCVSWAAETPSQEPRGRGDRPMSAMPGVVAINTFREAVRDRVLYNLVFFALRDDRRGDPGGPDFHRHRPPGDHQPRAFGDFHFRTGDGGIHRRGAGVQGNREAHAVQPSREADPAAGNSWWESMRGCC